MKHEYWISNEALWNFQIGIWWAIGFCCIVVIAGILWEVAKRLRLLPSDWTQIGLSLCVGAIAVSTFMS